MTGDDHDIGGVLQFGQCLEHHRPLAETQQPGDIWVRRALPGVGSLYQLYFRKGRYYGAGKDGFGFEAIGGIDGGHQRRLFVTGVWLHLFGHLPNYLARLFPG